MNIDWISMLDYSYFMILLAFIWAPRTWVPGELVTAALMNTSIRDYLNEALRVQTTTLTGSQNNFAIDGPLAYLRCNNASALTITGALIDGGNVDGAKVIIEALNSAVTLNHQDAASTAANRFIISDGADLEMAAYDRLLMIYDGTTARWRVNSADISALARTVGHEYHLGGDDEAYIENTSAVDIANLAIIEVDGSKLANSNVYFEATLRGENASNQVSAELYDITNTAIIASSQVNRTSDTFDRERSAALTLPAAATEFKARCFTANAATRVIVSSAKLIVL
jgi:hypothetical protein